jgi:hypothetical protein
VSSRRAVLLSPCGEGGRFPGLARAEIPRRCAPRNDGPMPLGWRRRVRGLLSGRKHGHLVLGDACARVAACPFEGALPVEKPRRWRVRPPCVDQGWRAGRRPGVPRCESNRSAFLSCGRSSAGAELWIDESRAGRIRGSRWREPRWRLKASLYKYILPLSKGDRRDSSSLERVRFLRSYFEIVLT